MKSCFIYMLLILFIGFTCIIHCRSVDIFVMCSCFPVIETRTQVTLNFPFAATAFLFNAPVHLLISSGDAFMKKMVLLKLCEL